MDTSPTYKCILKGEDKGTTKVCLFSFFLYLSLHAQTEGAATYLFFISVLEFISGQAGGTASTLDNDRSPKRRKLNEHSQPSPEEFFDSMPLAGGGAMDTEMVRLALDPSLELSHFAKHPTQSTRPRRKRIGYPTRIHSITNYFVNENPR